MKKFSIIASDGNISSSSCAEQDVNNVNISIIRKKVLAGVKLLWMFDLFVIIIVLD